MTHKFANLSATEKDFLTKFYSSILPYETEEDPSKWRFFDGEWVYIQGYGGIWFIPDDIEAWNKCEKEGLIPIAKEDDVPYRMGLKFIKTINNVPRKLKLPLGPMKEKYL